MSPDRDPRLSPGDEPDDELEDDDAPRSIFSATWFRVVLVLLAIGVVGAVAVPYVLDIVNPPEPAGPRTAVAPAPSTPPAAPSPAPTPANPSAPSAPATPPSPSPTPPSQGASPAKPSTPAPPASTTVKPPEGAGRPAAKAPSKPAEKPAEKTVAAAPRAASPAKATAAGDYFVQVGAYREEATAKRVAARLREQNYPVDESVKRVGGTSAPAPKATPRATTSAPDRYDVIVSGGSAAEINTRLAAKGLASEPAGDSVRIRPSLPLRDAVALSKDLGSEGFKVQVRRGGGTSSEPAPSTAPASDTGGQTLHRVRVGGYPDRAAAQTVLKELQDKGFQPFIAKGRE